MDTSNIPTLFMPSWVIDRIRVLSAVPEDDLHRLDALEEISSLLEQVKRNEFTPRRKN